jgi:hypothetical protein
VRWLIVPAILVFSAASSWAADVPAPVEKGRPQPGVVTLGPKGEQLTTAPVLRQPPDFTFELGRATHPDDRTNPFDPADQQRNQSHGLTESPGDDISLRPLFGR